MIVFSDGLIERRDEDIDTGFDRLREHLELLPGAAREVFAAVADPGGLDDATTLILRRSI